MSCVPWAGFVIPALPSGSAEGLHCQASWRSVHSRCAALGCFPRGLRKGRL